MVPEPKPTIPGNPVVIELLELYLKTARENPFGHVAIVMTGHPNVAACDFAGDVALEKSCKEAIGILDAKIDFSIAGWTPPPQDETLDASHVCYNVANAPLGFDFLVWLVDAEMTRIREGAPEPLKVGFFMGRGAPQQERVAWVENVFRPALSFIGAVEDDKAIRGRRKEIYVNRDIVAACKAGERVPQLRPPPTNSLILAADFVSITLREADHWPSRNSNFLAWVRFAQQLRAQGQNVVFVRDTAKADEPIHGFRTCPQASRDLRRRMELYSRAAVNLFVSNGPALLAAYGDKPWLSFINIQDCGSDTAKFWKEYQGVDFEGQYPWSAPDQRLIWEADTYDNLVRAWNAHFSSITSLAA